MKLAALIGGLGVLGATIAAPAAASGIDTSGSYASKIDYFGARYTPTYGQTFTVGSDNALNGFTFYLGGGAARVRAFVYAWGNSGPLATRAASTAPRATPSRRCASISARSICARASAMSPSSPPRGWASRRAAR